MCGLGQEKPVAICTLYFWPFILQLHRNSTSSTTGRRNVSLPRGHFPAAFLSISMCQRRICCSPTFMWSYSRIIVQLQAHSTLVHQKPCTWLWRWLPLRLSKRQSPPPTTVSGLLSTKRLDPTNKCYHWFQTINCKVKRYKKSATTVVSP